MLSGVPNFAFAVGYTNASWTLKVDLVAEYMCRLLGYMERTGHAVCTPQITDEGMERAPFMKFAAGYVSRAIDAFPKQGDTGPWKLNMSYASAVATLRGHPVDDGAMRFAAVA